MRDEQVYKLIASFMEARQANQRKMTQYAKNDNEPTFSNAEIWFERFTDRIEELVREFMPSGSGIDNGQTFDFDRSTSEKLVFHFGYHHMNDVGYYDGWTDHTCTVRPSLVSGISLSISGRNRNDVKDYLYQTFEQALTRVAYWNDATQGYQYSAPTLADVVDNPTA